MRRTLELTGYSRTTHELAYRAAIGGHSFTTRFRYPSLDLPELERRFGDRLVRSLYFHAIAFDLNRLVSLRPDAVDFGPFHDLVTEPFVTLWQQIVDGVWAQWRYENDLPHHRGPHLHRPPPKPDGGVEREGHSPFPRASGHSPFSDTLLFCGGGKDSLFAAKLFEEIGEPYDVFAYSHSGYGGAEVQHRLIDRLLDRCAPGRRHRLEIRDDFRPETLDLARLGVATVTAAETPSALFLALPLVLAHGYRHLVVAHERSANAGNLVWPATGEEINHQWGKSLAAEALLDEYVSRQLLADVRYFSALGNVHDPVIFHALRDSAEAVSATHSCNVSKPWCGRCAKCLYVFLGYAACLEPERVLEIFGANLFDVESNLELFAALVGRGEHLPFECVGQAEESRLLLETAARRGWTGLVIERLREDGSGTGSEALERLCAVHGVHQRLPAGLAERLMSALGRLGAGALAFFRAHLDRPKKRGRTRRSSRTRKQEGGEPPG